MIKYKIDSENTIVLEIECLDDTKQIAKTLADVLEVNDIITLDGDLGAGKTTFTQSLCQSLGVEDYVTSPTFTIMNVYEGNFPINHLDVYRIADIDEMFGIGFDQVLFAENIVIIEWASMIKEILPDKIIAIEINNNIDVDKRIMKIVFNDNRLEKFVCNLKKVI